jgi:uncharacterized protein (DUF305 family)
MVKRLLLLALAVPSVALAQHAHENRSGATVHDARAAADPAYPQFKKEMDEGMRRMMQDMHAPGYTGNPDVDFLAMMIPHHEGAIEMARLALVHGRDPATRRLAEEMIASQVVEIEGMKRRLATLRANGSHDAEFPALGGTRGPVKSP